jgi:hypothetical protein
MSKKDLSERADGIGSDKKNRESLAMIVVLKDKEGGLEFAQNPPGFADTLSAAKWIRTDAPAGKYCVAKMWPAVIIGETDKPIRTVDGKPMRSLS